MKQDLATSVELLVTSCPQLELALCPPLQAERCPTNSAARGVAEEALLRLGAALRARATELKSFYESIILGEHHFVDTTSWRLKRGVLLQKESAGVRARSTRGGKMGVEGEGRTVIIGVLSFVIMSGI